MNARSGKDQVARLLEEGQLTLADLVDLASRVGQRNPVPTHAEFLDRVVPTCTISTLRNYRPGFTRLVSRFADVSVDRVTAADLDLLCAEVLFAAHQAGYRDGTGAVRNFIHAVRFFYRVAQRAGHRNDNPGLSLRMPARRRHVRRALTGPELGELYTAIAAGGNDPGLDLLLLDFHRETAARRGGAIALRLCDTRPDRPSVTLHEKGGHEREVPASPELISRIRAHAAGRGASSPHDQVFRYSNGDPLTRRRYNTLFERVQDQLPWAGVLGVTIHWIRHTTLTDISNASGPRVAAAYAGHHHRTVTDLYTEPSFEDLALAHAQVFPDLVIRRP